MNKELKWGDLVKLATEKLIMSGHSFGGATALLVGNTDPRVKSVVTHDPWMYPITPDCDAGGFKT